LLRDGEETYTKKNGKTTLINVGGERKKKVRKGGKKMQEESPGGDQREGSPLGVGVWEEEERKSCREDNYTKNWKFLVEREGASGIILKKR